MEVSALYPKGINFIKKKTRSWRILEEFQFDNKTFVIIVQITIRRRNVIT